MKLRSPKFSRPIRLLFWPFLPLIHLYLLQKLFWAVTDPITAYSVTFIICFVLSLVLLVLLMSLCRKMLALIGMWITRAYKRIIQ